MSTTITIPVKFPFDPNPLRAAMKAQGISQRMLADESGIHYVHISRVLMGRSASPKMVEWLCERLDVPRSKVIGPAAGLSFLPPD